MLSKLSAVLLVDGALVTYQHMDRGQNCPSIHVFGVRETFAPVGFGAAGKVVDLILNAHPGATSEAIDYPATGHEDQPFSVQQGVKGVVNQVGSFVNNCPDTQIVLVGYSQGAQVVDDSMCNGGDPAMGITDTATPVPSDIASHVKAMIWMGNPRFTPGAPYNVGTSTTAGFDPRTSDQICSPYTSLIQSYCDSGDPYCSNGSDEDLHMGYGSVYGQDALEFVNSKLT